MDHQLHQRARRIDPHEADERAEDGAVKAAALLRVQLRHGLVRREHRVTLQRIAQAIIAVDEGQDDRKELAAERTDQDPKTTESKEVKID